MTFIIVLCLYCRPIVQVMKKKKFFFVNFTNSVFADDDKKNFWALMVVAQPIPNHNGLQAQLDEAQNVRKPKNSNQATPSKKNSNQARQSMFLNQKKSRGRA